MPPLIPPKAVAVEVVAARTTEADRVAIAHLSARENKPIRDEVYLVKVRFETVPPATSQGWALYVNKYRIPKYSAYKDGIYFKVFDPQFFDEHDGHSLQFSLNGTEFIDTGLKLEKPKPEVEEAARDASRLPEQAEALK